MATAGEDDAASASSAAGRGRWSLRARHDGPRHRRHPRHRARRGGGAGGAGRVRAHVLPRRGRAPRARLAEWAAAAGTRGAVTGSVCDVSARDQRERLLRDVAARFAGRLDILVKVNNVGTNFTKPTTAYTAEERTRRS